MGSRSIVNISKGRILAVLRDYIIFDISLRNPNRSLVRFLLRSNAKDIALGVLSEIYSSTGGATPFLSITSGQLTDRDLSILAFLAYHATLDDA